MLQERQLAHLPFQGWAAIEASVGPRHCRTSHAMIGLVSLVLLIDDEPRIARALEFALRNTEIRMSSLSDSSQIEQSLTESRPDAILLDIQMGTQDGLEVCRRLKADDRFDRIPVLLLSGQTSPDM